MGEVAANAVTTGASCKELARRHHLADRAKADKTRPLLYESAIGLANMIEEGQTYQIASTHQSTGMSLVVYLDCWLVLGS